ncbi:hypothetical protein M1P56_26095 [Streptomyces sp. HU2014]|uniref:DUF6571 family protein n=1 Tax=Streptomyces sp. HU2014 TaxID=2939414 RepID=UPI00200D0265|nr:DUF6571 family protein [Streptomyces sp. HU2014]UQI47566.1 hypothetical protein M1P56_26095 [Streptomyces sp. HU2014]
MLTYHQVMTTDLTLLTTAATQWDAAAKDFETAQKAYNSQVRNVGIDEQWQGVARTFAQIANTRTYEQYSAAAKEARAIASLLRDAHGQFVELRGKMKSAIADAAKEDMKIDENGKATWTKRDDPGVKNDPDAATAIPKAEASWTQHIADIVQQFDDADQGVKLALKAATQDSDPNDGITNGFNAKAEGDIEKVEAHEASRLAGIKDPDDKQRAEMMRLMRDNKNDLAFSQTFLNDLGPDKAIDYANRLRGQTKGDHKKDYEQLQNGLATTISTATRDPKSPFYEKWRKDLREAGAKNYGSKTNPMYGYQPFVELMKHGDKYGKQFLTDLGDDIISTEKKHEGIFNKIAGGHKGVGNDPLDGLLSIMGKQPDVATSFLDPGADGKNDRMKYLINERDWPKHTTIGPAGIKDFDDPTSRLGLGAALEAAATGDVPGTKHAIGGHTEAEARVMQNTIRALDADGKGDKLHANLRASVGHMLTDYTSDTHEIASNNSGRYTDAAPRENSAGEVWKDANGTVHMAVHQANLARIMRGVAEDPNAFATMYNAEQQYSAETMKRTSFDEEEDRKLTVRNAAGAFGFYDGVRADVVYDKRDAAIQWARDVSHAVTATSGAALNFVPAQITADVAMPKGVKVGADGLNRMLDFAMYEWTKEQISEATAAAGKDSREDFYAGQQQVDRLVREWGKSNGHTDQEESLMRNLVGDSKNQHYTARQMTLGALGRDH